MKKIGVLLLALLVLYSLAGLFHFSHNAIYLERYPNMPAWITRSGVMGAWLSVAAVGLLGYIVLRMGFRRSGLAILGAYAALGFDGLAHYCLAPIAAHRFDMNFTIWFEVLSGAALLGVVLWQLISSSRTATAA